MDKNENINLPTKVTVTLDLDKLYNELKENGWKPIVWLNTTSITSLNILAKKILFLDLMKA